METVFNHAPEAVTAFWTFALAIVSALLVVATAILATFTYGLFRDNQQAIALNQQALRDAKMPVIVFRYRVNAAGRFSSMIVNIGAGPALEVRLLSNFRAGTDGTWQFHDDIGVRPLAAGRSIGVEIGDPLLQIEFDDRTPPILEDNRLRLRAEYRDVFGQGFASEYANRDSVFLGPIG
jgi:uncharacterized SAM-binding protein YcdF (DUF218 family)